MENRRPSEEKFPAAQYPVPTWEVDWGSVQANINLRLLHGLLESEHTTLTRAKEKDLILLLGLSGAGKSTTVNYFKSCEMESYFTDTGEEHLKPMEGNQTYAKMGCTVESETLAPNIIPLSDSRYFADCPGFEDNRGKEYQICAKVTTQSAIRWSNSVKAAVVLINYPSDIAGKAANFQRLVRELKQVFNDLEAVSPSVLFLVNRAPDRLKPQQVINKIKQLKDAAQKKLKNCQSVVNPDKEQKKELDEILAQLTFFDLMLSHQDNIMMVNPLDDGASRELIMERLATFAPIDRKQFNLPTHNNDHIEFNKLLALLFEKGTELLTQGRDLRKNISDDASEYQRLTTQTLPEAEARLSDAKTNKNKSVFQLQLDANQASQREERLQIDKLKREIALLQKKRTDLGEEEKNLNTEEPVVHFEKEAVFPSSVWITLACGGVGAVALVGLVGSGGMAAAAGIGAASAGGSSAITSFVLSRLLNEEFEYRGEPYPRAEFWTNGSGRFILEKDNPAAGVYSAKFYGNPLYESKASVTIKLPKKNIPDNARRLKKIAIEIEALKKEEGKLNAAKMARSDALETLEARAELIQQEIQKEELRLKESDQPAKSSPEEWEELITELQKSVYELNHKIAALKIRLVDLPVQLRAVEQETKQRWSFMNFLNGVADFTNLSQGTIFNVLFKETHLFKLEAQLLQASGDDNDGVPPPPPYEVNEAKGDDGRPAAAPQYGSVFNQGASGNEPNVPPKYGIKLPSMPVKTSVASPD